jgi:hypothetical protein
MMVVVVIQVVDAQDFIPALEQLEAGVEANEAGSTGNQIGHEVEVEAEAKVGVEGMNGRPGNEERCGEKG